MQMFGDIYANTHAQDKKFRLLGATAERQSTQWKPTA
jgi:hypothetical protein